MELLQQVNFVIVDRNHPESQRVIQVVHLLGGKVVYERGSLIVFGVTDDDATGKSP
jgi:hypothetical protein